jgi:hypothetical protein
MKRVNIRLDRGGEACISSYSELERPGRDPLFNAGSHTS